MAARCWSASPTTARSSASRRTSRSCGKKNADGWELWLTDLLTNWLGRAAATDVTLRYGVVDGRTVARIAVWPAARPVFLNAKGEKKGVFLVRVNSSTRELSGDDAFTYQQKRWPS